MKEDIVKKPRIKILEIIHIIITLVYCFFLTIEKTENGRVAEPEKGPILGIAFGVAIISLIYTITKLCILNKLKKQEEDIKDDYNEMFLGAMTVQQSIIVVCSTMIGCFCIGLTDAKWVFHEKYLITVMFFISQLISYFSFFKIQIHKENYFLKKYIIMSIIILPILVISRFILGH